MLLRTIQQFADSMVLGRPRWTPAHFIIRIYGHAHFDEKKMLGSILRMDADLPEEVRKAIRAHYGVDNQEKKVYKEE